MDKIKINVDTHTNNILLKDAEMFEFYKKDGITLNRNALLTKIIVNYHEAFQQKQQAMLKSLQQTIAQSKLLNTSQASELALVLTRTINKQEHITATSSLTHTINLKPTTASAAIIDYIDQYLLSGSGVSEYFRNLLVSYAKQSPDERERIIFAENYNLLRQAIKERKKVFITLKSVVNLLHESFEAAPYALVTSREELHYYLLAGSQQGKNYSIRLSRIGSVKILLDGAAFTVEQEQIFAKMIKYGPQYVYDNNEQEVHIKLTPVGVDKYRRMYIHRPIPERVAGNNYYFNCSHNQIAQYFVRFGKEAFVVSPAAMQNRILQFYVQARKTYLKERESITL